MLGVAARHIRLNGLVQGVGFRPYVYKLAAEMGLKGWVQNFSQGVDMHIEGENLDLFYRRLLREVPALAVITQDSWEPAEPQGYDGFQIIPSKAQGAMNSLISPDVATCPECLAEMMNQRERRYHYPFTNCTNCGPRYTIIKDSPYDRSRTTMHSFPLCADCAREYEDPEDRRFHAQPVACPVCG
ncbi:MAG: acylphosphatase, partial [Peptococcaceae bacterium]|nr:acylphosphatase [Peptococcaceae bacterium]